MGHPSRKIRTCEELVELIGRYPRSKPVIMCHGTFDIVHPGHIRHLMYAKEKAPILIASLTCDAQINKANFRPFVPEQLRALNLAALEVVDFVVIDPNPTPIENLRFIQPDYFAKGYEYGADGVHPKTREEIQAIEAYGGEIVFTPGDIVYSSSQIIESRLPPRLAAEKLKILMDSEGLDFDALRGTIRKFRGASVHVVGDTIVDSYVHTSMIGGGSKTPTLSVRSDEEIDYVGGAGVVSKHIAAAGGKVRFSTVVGDDKLRDFVQDDLARAGVECNLIVDKTRPTTKKTTYICKGHRLLKVDQVDNRTVSERITEKLSNALSESAHFDAVVFSDFRHGIFAKSTIPALVRSIPAGVLKVADSQVASRWGNILEFKAFDLITPNEKEARFALGDQDLVVRPLALKVYEQAECRYLILKLGENGIITYRPGETENPRKFFTIDSFAEKVVDAVGSGDALLAYSTLALAAGGNECVASILGSVAAAIACESEGNVPVSADSVAKRLDLLERRIRYE